MGCGALPVVGGRVTSGYGAQRAHSVHRGVDIQAPEGTPVHSVLAGQVIASVPSGELDGYGETVVVLYPRWYVLYAHLGSRAVSAGQRVTQGQVIGTVGRSAGTRVNPHVTTRSAHLHLEFLSQWPVRSGGGGRLDAARAFEELGFIAPPRAPMVVDCAGAAPPPLPVAAPKAGGAAGGAALALAALYVLAQIGRNWR